jgi:hypothetical protein
VINEYGTAQAWGFAVYDHEASRPARKYYRVSKEFWLGDVKRHRWEDDREAETLKRLRPS